MSIQEPSVLLADGRRRCIVDAGSGHELRALGGRLLRGTRLEQGCQCLAKLVAEVRTASHEERGRRVLSRSMMTVWGMALAAYFSATAPSRSSATFGCSLCRSSMAEICFAFFLQVDGDELDTPIAKLVGDLSRPGASPADKGRTRWPRSRG